MYNGELSRAILSHRTFWVVLGVRNKSDGPSALSTFCLGREVSGWGMRNDCQWIWGSFWGDENLKKLMAAIVAHPVSILKMTELYTFNRSVERRALDVNNSVIKVELYILSLIINPVLLGSHS